MLSKQQWRLFEETVNAISFPSHAGRLPTSVRARVLLSTLLRSLIIAYTSQIGSNPSLKKADELRTWSVIAPAVLYAVWKDHDDRLPTNAAKIPAQTKSIPAWKANRNPEAIFSLIMRLSAALRILALRAISMDEVEAACEDIRQYCRLRLVYGIPLTISHHLAAAHYPEFFERYGPAYAHWLFPFESFNGVIERMKTNGHGNGEMELTMLRKWIQRQLTYDLVSRAKRCKTLTA